MKHIIQIIRVWEDRIACRTDWLASRYPFLAFLGVFIGIPVVILVGVFLITVMIVLPMAWLLGWR